MLPAHVSSSCPRLARVKRNMVHLNLPGRRGGIAAVKIGLQFPGIVGDVELETIAVLAGRNQIPGPGVRCARRGVMDCVGSGWLRPGRSGANSSTNQR
jgi:hypothetical protein